MNDDIRCAPVLTAAPRSPSTALDAFVAAVPAGRIDSPPDDHHVIDMHVGRPIDVGCTLDGRVRRGVQTEGMFCLLPAGAMGTWIVPRSMEALILRLSPSLLVETADAMGLAPSRAKLTPAIQARDRHVATLAALARAEREEGNPAGRLYTDSLAAAIAAVSSRSRRATPSSRLRPRYPLRACAG